MEALWLLWSSMIPAVPLVLTHGTVMAAVTNAALLLCVAALWLERERRTSKPQGSNDHRELPLAA